MLAQTFKTADALRIPKQVRDALIETLALMESGKLVHVRSTEAVFVRFGDDNAPFTGHFSMDSWADYCECGTVACIGGTAELVGGLRSDTIKHVAMDNAELHNLFYPLSIVIWHDISVERAAQALRAYLTTGHADW